MTKFGSTVKKNAWYDLFRIQNLLEGFAAVVKKRKYHKRAFIILLIIAFELEIFAMKGKCSCMFLYFRRTLEWSIMEFSMYTSFLGALGMVAQYLLVPLLTTRLKLHDSTIALLGKCSNV